MKVFAMLTRSSAVHAGTAAAGHAEGSPRNAQTLSRGKIEQFWFRDKAGPIFLMNVASLDEAQSTMDSLPLVKGNLATYELIPREPADAAGVF